MTDWLIIISTILLSAIFSGLASVDGTNNVSGAVTLDNNSVTAKVLTGLPSPSASSVLATDSIVDGIGKLQSQINGLLEPQFKLFTENTLFILLLQTIVSTIVILLFAEYLPKTLFRLKPNLTLRFFSYPMYAIFWSLFLGCKQYCRLL